MTVRVTDDTPQAELLAALEGRCRRLMANRAATPCSWQFRQRRRELLAELNDSLDEFNSTNRSARRSDD